MNIEQAKQTLRGPMIPVITNLKDDLSIDHEAITANVHNVIWGPSFVSSSGAQGYKE